MTLSLEAAHEESLWYQYPKAMPLNYAGLVHLYQIARIIGRVLDDWIKVCQALIQS